MAGPTFEEGDIEGAIIDALESLFTQELTDAVDSKDYLRLKHLDTAPLQADPTKNAPYLVYAPAYEIGRMIDKDGGFEVGGPALWKTYFKAVIGTPRINKKTQAYKAINELSRRAERCLMRHYDLSNILVPGKLTSADQTEWIDAQDPEKMWVRTVRRVYGGGTQFYGQALMIWSYNFYRIKDW